MTSPLFESGVLKQSIVFADLMRSCYMLAIWGQKEGKVSWVGAVAAEEGSLVVVFCQLDIHKGVAAPFFCLFVQTYIVLLEPCSGTVEVICRPSKYVKLTNYMCEFSRQRRSGR